MNYPTLTADDIQVSHLAAGIDEAMNRLEATAFADPDEGSGGDTSDDDGG